MTGHLKENVEPQSTYIARSLHVHFHTGSRLGGAITWVVRARFRIRRRVGVALCNRSIRDHRV